MVLTPCFDAYFTCLKAQSNITYISYTFYRFMNKISPKKMLNSKWTAVKPIGREKHFLITELEFSDEGQVVECTIEAIISKRSKLIDWQELKNNDLWLQGWK